jgi:hypothetical protein
MQDEFEKWWEETYYEAFKNVGGALHLSFKEVAKKAYDQGQQIGYLDGVRANPPCNCSCGCKL